ncbi:MAG TPA: tautomerase family protein [Solirubrobacteraceae bacterium]|nr:tautomerase family protein [Solirubrobacteraceae bacterium]
MALVRIEVLQGRSAEQKRQLLAAARDALVSALRVPPGDPTLRLVELDPLDVMLPTDPYAMSELFALVEITMFSGRSLQAKRRLYRELVGAFTALGIPELDITIVILESSRENWGVRGGLSAEDVDLGFSVEI